MALYPPANPMGYPPMGDFSRFPPPYGYPPY